MKARSQTRIRGETSPDQTISACDEENGGFSQAGEMDPGLKGASLVDAITAHAEAEADQSLLQEVRKDDDIEIADERDGANEPDRHGRQEACTAQTEQECR